MEPWETMHALTFTNASTISQALVAYALMPDSTDDRIRSVIKALRAIDYTNTADTIEELQADSSSVMRERIEAYTRRGE